jgi:dienelactone hydrolase
MNEPSDPHYEHLGPFSGLVTAAKALQPLFPAAPPGTETRRRAREVLRFSIGADRPGDLRTERSWEKDGVSGEEISWSVGFGPRTHAYVLKPSGNIDQLPGMVALHDHGHYKFYGKEKIANGPEGPLAPLGEFRNTYYGGRAYANLLAREGYVVLVHDTFLWGSRRFPLEVMPERERELARAVGATLDQESAGAEIAEYNGAAYLHEHLVSKYCTLLGTSFAAVVAYEDRVALNYLRSRADVDSRRVGCIGLSGGGSRAALLRTTSDDLDACAIIGMMSTYEGLLDNCVAPHTWMLFPAGWSLQGDWPDLAASGAPKPLLVQFLLDDAQFTVSGMRDADARIAAHYAHADAEAVYAGQFYRGPHRFDMPMQEAAFAWLQRNLQ